MQKSQPNILIVYADQMRYDSMSPSGNRIVKTPHLQRLADEGVTFDNAYTSYPLCCPFRASLMTGKQAQGHGMTQNHFPLRADQDFVAEHMAQAGYQTLYVGKWHLEGGPKPGFVPPDRRFGFENFVGFNRGHQYLDGIFWRDTDQPYRCKRYEPDYQTDHLLDFINQTQQQPDKPFFGVISYGPPHHPNEMPEYWRKMYDPEDIDLPVGVLSPEEQVRVQTERVEIDCEGNMKAALRSRCAYNTKKPLEPETEEEQRVFIAEYYAMISNIDHNVGRIMSHLDAKGISDNTLVIFLSDHGDLLGEHGFYCGYKPQAYRSAMQVPFIVRYPERFNGGQRVDGFIDVGIDTPVTLLEMVGAKPLSDAHGQSYLGLLDGTTTTGRDHIMYQTFRMNDGAKGEFTPVPERGIRTKEWLYVRQPQRRKFLFNQTSDPNELNNLVGQTEHDALMATFDKQLEEYMLQTGDEWEMAADFPPPDFLTHEAADEYLKNELLPRAIASP